MFALEKGSLMAMLMASSALASFLPVAEPLASRDLETRQSGSCLEAYTSKNGLNFTTYCEQNNPFNDAIPSFKAASFPDCMEHCSRFWGTGEGCFGVVWVKTDGACWIRNSNTSTAGLVATPDHFSALIKEGQMTGYDEACPNSDRSINTLPGVAGMQYTTNCNKVISGFDQCFSGYPKCLDSPFIGYYHTESLLECLNICINEHPLCKAVSWNAGLEIGFANCWLKDGFPSTLSDPNPQDGVIHSATITQIDSVDRTCPASKTYTAQGNKNFELHCGQVNTGTNFTMLHTQNVTACMDSCATSDKGCIGVSFDSSLSAGYNNCYLQNSTNVIVDSASATYAILGGTSNPSSGPATPGSNPNSSDSSSNSSSSKAWIAGPVIGGLAGLAIIGFALFWWRRRKARAAAGLGVEKGPSDTHGAYGAAPAYSPGVNGTQPYYDAPANEMDGRHTMELPASTKYAHAQAGKGPAHELPS